MALIDRWKKSWKLQSFRNQLLWSVPVLLASLVLVRLFLEYVEARNGIVLPDPLLSGFSPIDLNRITFVYTYATIFLALGCLVVFPFRFLLAIRAFVVMIALRIICLLVLPLDPPAGIIPLVDPLVRLPFDHQVLTRDLFFSWQVAVLALPAFVLQGREMKMSFSILAAVIALLLLLQHAQYTISVVAAPCFAYASYGIARAVTAGGNGGSPAGMG